MKTALDIIVYHSIEEKQTLEHNLFKALTPAESVQRTLDVMDLMISFRKDKVSFEEEDIPWIVLEIEKK